MAATRISKMSERLQASSANDDDADEDSDDSELFTVCSEIASEEDLLAPVHRALNLWESCFPADGMETKKGIVVWERTVDWSVSIDYVEVLMLICKSMEVALHL